MSSEMYKVAADAFFAGRNDKGKYPKQVFGMYRIEVLPEMDQLIYKTSDNKIDLIAIRTPKASFCNSSVLPLVGRSFAWGNEQQNRGESNIQRYLRDKGMPMLPIYQLTQNGFTMTSFECIEQGKAETVTVTVPKRWVNGVEQPEVDETRHFTGAALYRVADAKGKKSVFLFDIDRNEIAHKVFNPFFVQINKPVKTIAEAYQALKPKLVVDAEKKKLAVKRQGEWFFIPTNYKPKGIFNNEKDLPYGDRMILSMELGWRGDRLFTESELKSLRKKQETIRTKVMGEKRLQAGNNRPNTVNQGITVKGVTYVKGMVKHTGREHKDLMLGSWHIAIPNTSIASWQLDGNID